MTVEHFVMVCMPDELAEVMTNLCKLLCTSNSKPWRGRDSGQWLLSRTSSDRLDDGSFLVKTSFEWRESNEIAGFKLYREIDFSEYDFGTCASDN